MTMVVMINSYGGIAMEINWSNVITNEVKNQEFDQFLARLDHWAVMIYGRPMDDLDDHQQNRVLDRALA